MREEIESILADEISRANNDELRASLNRIRRQIQKVCRLNINLWQANDKR